MKKYAFVLLVTLVFLTGCGKKEVGNDLSKPPELKVVCGEESVQAVKGTFAWSYPQANGTTAHIIADALLPLEMKELLTPLTIRPSTQSRTNPRTAYLLFDGPLPDQLQVYRWVDGPDDPYTVHMEAEKAEMGKVGGRPIYGFEFLLTEEYAIYEVCAQWGSSEYGGGEVSYVFAAQLQIPTVQGIQ